MGDRSEKGAPRKLSTWRLTSPASGLIKAAAELWGGEVVPWDKQWEVITETDTLPIVVPPQDPENISWYELWAKGGLKRKCDGVAETLKSTPCLCDPENRECKPMTRVNVMLPDLPDVGQWLLTSTGWYAAVELNATIGFIMQQMGKTGWMPEATLVMDQREVKRPGQPVNKFVVPTIHISEKLSEFIESSQRPSLGTHIPPSGGALTAGSGEEEASASLPVPPPAPTPVEIIPPPDDPLGELGPSDALLALLDANPTVGNIVDIEERVRDLYRLMANDGYWTADAFHAGLNKFLNDKGMGWSSPDGPHWSDLARKSTMQAFATKSFEAAREKVLQ